jgi:hypothetical protein
VIRAVRGFTALPNAKFQFRLSEGFATAPDGSTVKPYVQGTSDANREFVVALWANDDLIPAGTFYVYTELQPSFYLLQFTVSNADYPNGLWFDLNNDLSPQPMQQAAPYMVQVSQGTHGGPSG